MRKPKIKKIRLNYVVVLNTFGENDKFIRFRSWTGSFGIVKEFGNCRIYKTLKGATNCMNKFNEAKDMLYWWVWHNDISKYTVAELCEYELAMVTNLFRNC